MQHVALARLADLDATIIASATRLGPADKAAIAELVLQEVLDRVGCRLVVVALLLLEARCAALRLQAAFCCWQALGQVTQCMRDSHELIDQPSADPRPRWLTTASAADHVSALWLSLKSLTPPAAGQVALHPADQVALHPPNHLSSVVWLSL